MLVRFEAACTKSNVPMVERKEGREGGREAGSEDAAACRKRMAVVRRRGTREAVKVQGRVASTYSCTRVGKEGGDGGVDAAEAFTVLLPTPLAVDAAGRGRRVGGMSAVWKCKGEEGGRGGRGGRSEAKSRACVRVVCLVWYRTKKVVLEENTLTRG